MSKKRKRISDSIFMQFDARIEKLALERLLSGKQIFDYKTKRLHRYIRDAIQGRAILIRAEQLAVELEKELWLSSLEKRLLAKVFNEVVKIVAFAFALSSLPFVSDQDNDGGSPDVAQSFVHTFEMPNASP